MYCGACTRDVNLLRGLIARGHDVEVIPLYTPLHTDYDAVPGSSRIFYGGINAYLQQVSAVFQHTPSAVDAILDNPALLRWVSKFAISVSGEKLGPMTVSVLSGHKGRQRKELAKLMSYLEQGPRPDVINITNSLLSCIAPEIKDRLRVPVVCTLQGEDAFVGIMPEPFRSQAQSLMQRNCADVDCFVSPGKGYADRMSEFLSVSSERIRVIHAGIDTSLYRNSGHRPKDPFTIGYLSVINPAKGLDILVDAFILLDKSASASEITLRVAGKIQDKAYWKSIVGRVAEAGLSSRFEHLGEVDMQGKVEFLRQCSVFSVPSRMEESRGMAVMEAMAAGVPVIVPNTGVFPEMLSMVGGGLLFKAGDSRSLADALHTLLHDPDSADVLGKQGAAGIEKHYSADRMADETIEAYSRLIAL
jgi:glycosyltransferase involved in cell wall biosynthesis